MTDLSQYKFIFADFDGTFCLHEVPIDYASPEILFEPVDMAALMWFTNSYLNKAIYNLLIENGKNNIILLTASGSKQLEAKKIWLRANAPGINFKCASVSADCSKKQYIAAFRQKLNLGFEDILLIDDDPAIVNDIERSQVCTARTPEYLIQGEVKAVEPPPPVTMQSQLNKLTQDKSNPVAKVKTQATSSAVAPAVAPAEQDATTATIRRVVLKEEGVFQTDGNVLSGVSVLPFGHYYLFAKYYWKSNKVYQGLLKFRDKAEPVMMPDLAKARGLAFTLAGKNCKEGCDDGNILCVAIVEVNFAQGNYPTAQKIIFSVPQGEVSEKEIEHRGLIMVSQRGMN